MNTQPTPAVQPRNLYFELAQELATDWCGGDAFRTAWFNALSLTFPVGEKFFVDSVRYYKSLVTDADLLADVRAFVGQETLHSREHQRFNDTLCRLRGYDQGYLELLCETDIAERQARGPAASLADTVLLEHIFAFMGMHVLQNLDGSILPENSRVSDLWHWHAYEESEHRHVAFAVYRVADLPLGLRRKTMLSSSYRLFRLVLRNLRHLLKPLPTHQRIRSYLGGVVFLLGPMGLNWRLLRSFYHYWQADFHPLQHHQLPNSADQRVSEIAARSTPGQAAGSNTEDSVAVRSVSGSAGS